MSSNKAIQAPTCFTPFFYYYSMLYYAYWNTNIHSINIIYNINTNTYVPILLQEVKTRI